ncbi:peptidoglycan/LPS O-acetylase OafA/YrhL [Mucilaginibacter yixingensis]|uniref:Peptidoglycan/LPS O-acetylase OafA/YrhL n=1 Tax=Mucilaginibacter yixingensis TaxID=1295612 RepID=A0A2T5J8P3_9SPHI|nr:acyltransferase [Mucilaginibacter yixingensis]PTQ95764.1 peptidoglycan/LPS O-acetylase OafA/YrhL [Mucilaginibacter yixingensis]
MEEQKEFRINNFDLLRLLAAIEVVFDHYFQHLSIPISHTAEKVLYLFPGVPVFFVISGYLISASYERNPGLKNYFRNRALRIYPGLWGCIILAVIAISLTGVSFLNKQAAVWLPIQMAGLSYTPAFLTHYGFGSWNGSVWTIPIELQFYLLMPVCFFLAPKKHLNAWFAGLFLVFLGASIACRLIPLDDRTGKILQYSFIPHFYLFLVGVIFQRLRIYQSAFIYGKALYWMVAYVAFTMFLYDSFPRVYFDTVQYLFMSLVMLSMAYTLPNLANQLLRKNDISYGIYIYHGVILTIIVQLKLVSHVNLPLVLALSMLMGTLSWIFIEKPFIKRKERALRKVE